MIDREGNPWFVAADVRSTLGLVRGGNRGFLNADELLTIRELNGVTLKGYGLSLISESGLYKLVMRSDKPTMSSREIAELCGKLHDNVLRDVRKMLNELGQDALKFEAIYHDAYGREKACFNLPKDLTVTLITGYRVDLRYKVIKRLEELEAQVKRPAVPALPNFSNPAEAARAWAAEFEAKQIAVVERDQFKVERDEARAVIIRDAPKVAVAGLEKTAPVLGAAKGRHGPKHLARCISQPRLGTGKMVGRTAPGLGLCHKIVPQVGIISMIYMECADLL